MSNGDHHLFRDNEIFGQDFVRSVNNLCPTLITIIITNLFKLFPNDPDDQGIIAKYTSQPLDTLDDLLIILDDLVPFQTGQSLQTHI